MCGAKIKDMYFWVPLYGNGALGLSIFSFANHVVFTTLSDPEVVDNPTVLCEEFVKGFDQLELMVMGQNYENTTDESVVEKTKATIDITKSREMQRRSSRAISLPEDIRRSIAEARNKEKGERSVRESSRGGGGGGGGTSETVMPSTQQ